MPAWASRCKKGKKATCKPRPKAYGAFVTALGRRYSGRYADENQGGGLLPRVSRWSLLNEPNQPGWLTPQYERKKHRLVATAAVVYRALGEDDVILRAELDELATRRGAEVHYVIGEPLSPERLLALVPDIAARDVYVCGSPAMTEATHASLARTGVSRRHIVTERFAF